MKEESDLPLGFYVRFMVRFALRAVVCFSANPTILASLCDILNIFDLKLSAESVTDYLYAELSSRGLITRASLLPKLCPPLQARL